jgi:hypothetical protein
VRRNHQLAKGRRIGLGARLLLANPANLGFLQVEKLFEAVGVDRDIAGELPEGRMMSRGVV